MTPHSNTIKVLITGATGMVGKGVLLECLEDPRVSSVITVGRTSTEITHSKLKEYLLPDLFQLKESNEPIPQIDACFFCLGGTSFGLSEEAYAKFTYDLPVYFAEWLLPKNPELSFCYVSGAGTDSSGKSKTMWARVKGRAENTLSKMPFKDFYAFRPGYIQPGKGIRSRVAFYNWMLALVKPLYPLLKQIPGLTTSTTQIGKAMINSVLKSYPTKTLTNRDINQLADRDSN